MGEWGRGGSPGQGSRCPSPLEGLATAGRPRRPRPLFVWEGRGHEVEISSHCPRGHQCPQDLIDFIDFPLPMRPSWAATAWPRTLPTNKSTRRPSASMPGAAKGCCRVRHDEDRSGPGREATGAGRVGQHRLPLPLGSGTRAQAGSRVSPPAKGQLPSSRRPWRRATPSCPGRPGVVYI